MSISTSYDFKILTSERLMLDVPAISNPVLQKSFPDSGRMDGTTVPPARLDVANLISLTAGVATIDLTTLASINGATVSGNGLMIQLLKLVNKGSHAMTFSKGSTNGYSLTGSTWTETLHPGQKLMFFGNNATPLINSTEKTIDVTGTDTEQFELHVVMG